MIFLDEGEYVCPRCTVFGLDKEELAKLMQLGIKFTDHNKEEDGYEAHTSIFKVHTYVFSLNHFPENFPWNWFHGKTIINYIFLYIHFQLMRELGKNFGFEQHGKPVCTSAPGDRKTLVYTLTKDC